MKPGKLVVSIIFLSMTLLGFRTDNQELSSDLIEIDPCQSNNLAFKNGEVVVYKIYYNWNFVWLSAGEVTFTIREMQNDIHISAVGITYPSYEWFFKVNDYYSTLLDKKTLLPKEFTRDIEEGNYKLYNKIHFDQKTGKAVSYKGKNSTDDLKRVEYQFDECMHDMLSLVYYLRNVDYSNMKKNDVFPMKMFLDREAYNLKVTYNGKKKNTKVKSSGRYNTIHFSPETIAGKQFKEGTAMDVYVSDDKNKIPVMVESPVSVGSIKAVLIEHKNLKHPFTAKIN